MLNAIRRLAAYQTRNNTLRTPILLDPRKECLPAVHIIVFKRVSNDDRELLQVFQGVQDATFSQLPTLLELLGEDDPGGLVPIREMIGVDVEVADRNGVESAGEGEAVGAVEAFPGVVPG